MYFSVCVRVTCGGTIRIRECLQETSMEAGTGEDIPCPLKKSTSFMGHLGARRFRLVAKGDL